MIKPAVREVNAFWLLLRNAAVPAFETAVAISALLAAPPRTTQTANTLPSRSVTAITLFGETWTARVTARLMIVCTSAMVSGSDAAGAGVDNGVGVGVAVAVGVGDAVGVGVAEEVAAV